MRALGFIVIAYLLLPVRVISQEDLYFQYITVDQGLPSNTVSTITQDFKGYMWIGSLGEGVYRYDGYDFKVFQNTYDDPKSLSHNSANVVYEDSDKNLWIGTWNGLNLYNRKLDNFTRFLSGQWITTIFNDSKNRLWAGGQSGLNIWNEEDSSFTLYQSDSLNYSSLISDNVTYILEDQQSNIWVICDKGLNLYVEEKDQFLRFSVPNEVSRITSAVIDSQGQFWISTYGSGLWLFNQAKGDFIDQRTQIRIEGSHNEFVDVVRKILEDNSKNLWVVTDGSGLGLLDPSSKVQKIYVYDPYLNGGLSDDNLMTIYQDLSGNIWIGSYNRGIMILKPSQNKFKRFYHHPLKKNGLSSNLVNSVYQNSNGDLWISTDGGGIDFLDFREKQVTHFRHSSEDLNSLSNDKVGPLIEDSEGWIWAGHVGSAGGITKFHPASGIFVRYHPGKVNSKFLSSSWINALHQDTYGNFWIGGDQGLDFYNSKLNQWAHYPDKGVWDIYEDPKGTIWVGGFRIGLKYLDVKNNKLVPVVDAMVSSICPDRKGNLWLSTLEDGLIKYQPDSQKISKFTKKTGFLTDDCHGGLIEDYEGSLWVGSNMGLVKLDPENVKTTVLGQSESALKHYMNPLLRTRDGTLYFGGTNGIIAFHPDSIRPPPVPYTPEFTDFQLFNEKVLIGEGSVLTSSISEIEKITLSHKQGVFTIQYASLSFDEPENTQYSFKLEGYDETWRDVGRERSATYTNLDAGTYDFQVKAGNQNGVWNEQPASLKIIVLPPPWKTWWAYSIYGVMFLTLLYAGRRQIVQRERLKSRVQMEHLELEKIRELDHLKSRFFTNISHEFRTPLTLIQGPLKSLLNDSFKGEVKDAYRLILRNSERVLQLINQLLDLAKLEGGKLRLQATQNDLIEFTKVISASFSSLAESRSISFGQHFPYDQLWLYYQQEMLEKVIINLLSNAFKFTPEGGEVSIIISKHSADETEAELFPEGFVKIGIRDSGAGIPEDQVEKIFDRFYQVDSSAVREQEGSGIGLALARELVELHHGLIKVESSLGQGSLFEIQMPFGKSHLMPSEISEKSQPHNLPGRFLVDQGGKIIDVAEIEPDDNSKPIVLIVEDNSELRSFMGNQLSQNYQIKMAANGQQGLELGLELIPDLVITDLMMPKMDGVELCKRLKEDHRTSHIPIIILTAKADAESKLEGLQTGADSYLTKPFDEQELLVRVQQMIAQRQKLKEFFAHEVKLQPKDINITSADENFLNRIMGIIESNMEDETFSVEKLGHEFGMSRSQIHRKLKALTDQSATELIRNFRLHRGMELLKNQAGTVSEIAYRVGFSSPVYFTKCFHQYYGYSPGQVKKNLNK